MAIDVIMPQMGADMTEGTLVRWLKQVGDEVKRGDILAEIETDKATVELEAFEGGVLRQHVVEEGETVPVGQVIAILGDPGEEVAAPERMPRPEVATRKIEAAAPSTAAPSESAEPPVVQSEVVATAAPAATPPSEENAASADGRVRISPVARRIAEDAGIDPATLAGSGPDGRILRRDVEAAIQGKKPSAAPPVPAQVHAPRLAPAAGAPAGAAAAPFELQPLSRMRQAIARRMLMSKRNQPCYYLTVDVDMTEALAFRERANASATDAQRVSINDLVVKALAVALQRHPKFNAEFTDAGVRVFTQINIDIAIALDEGLIAPCILDCGSKSLGTIASEAKDLFARAKSGHLKADELSAGTFSVTNLGAFGVETLIGIIKPPQASILGVGSVMAAAVVREGQVVARQVMKIALSADHRVSDGAEGARFIKEVQGLLENPASMAL